jgi:hypothetical protein
VKKKVGTKGKTHILTRHIGILYTFTPTNKHTSLLCQCNFVKNDVQLAGEGLKGINKSTVQNEFDKSPCQSDLACRISTSLKITLLYFRPDLITFITSCITLTFIYRTFSIYYELSLTFLTNKREQETHFLYFCFQEPLLYR